MRMLGVARSRASLKVTVSVSLRMVCGSGRKEGRGLLLAVRLELAC